MANVSYLSWTTDDLIQWIISLDPSYPEKYYQILNQLLSVQNIRGLGIDEFDREDLLGYGIVDLDDRRKIYKAMTDLIVYEKKRRRGNSDDDDTKDYDPDIEEQILSLSDDEGDSEHDSEDKLTLLAEDQQCQMKEDGFCVLDDPMKNEHIVTFVHGFVRENGSHFVINELIRIIVDFYSSRYNEAIYVEIVSKNEKDPSQNMYFLAPKINLSLCGLVTRGIEMDRCSRVEIDKVRPDVMRNVLRYLGHHKGKKPEEIAKPIRSVKMERIVADKWDAIFINSMVEKDIYIMILAANYLDIPCLMHLGCAKIATLIKGKSPEEIQSILADDKEE